MGVGKDCKCAEEFCGGCRCHAKTIFRWRGDFDFTNHRTLADFPGYREALDTSQPDPTSMLWRIRYDFEDEEWLDYMVATGLSFSTGAVKTSALPGNGREIFVPIPNQGPVRDGVMMDNGTSEFHYSGSTPLHNARLFGWDFRGRLHNYEAAPPPLIYRGRSLAVSIPQEIPNQGFPTFYEDLPWALDIGCVRCGYSYNAITWPPIDAVSYTQSTFPRPSDWYAHPEHRNVTRTRTLNRCVEMSEFEQNISYFHGNAADPAQPPPCPPDVILWNHIRRFQEGSHNVPTVHPTTKTAEFYGWAQSLQTIRNSDFSGTDVVALLGDRRYFQNGEVFPALTTDDLDVLNDWLDLGGKTLLITCPSTTTLSLLPVGDPDGLLASIGATMRIGLGSASVSHYTALYDTGYRDKWVGTSDDLATGLPYAYTRPRSTRFIIGSVVGGTPLLNTERALNSAPPVETWPMISYETLASGSRVVLYAMAAQYGFNQQDVVPPEQPTVNEAITKVITANAIMFPA